MAERFLNAATTFLVTDVERTIEWYERVLGFEVATSMRGHGPGQDDDVDDEHEHTSPVVFAIIQRGDVAVMLAATTEPIRPNRDFPGASEAIDLYVWMVEPQDVANLHDLCEQRGVPAVCPLGETFYDMVEFGIADCDGRMIVFGA